MYLLAHPRRGRSETASSRLAAAAAARGRSVQFPRSKGRPPRSSQLGCGEGDNTHNEEYEYRDCQVGLLFEFLKTFIDPGRSSEKDRAYEEENRDRDGDEGYNLENHFPLPFLLWRGQLIRRDVSPPALHQAGSVTKWRRLIRSPRRRPRADCPARSNRVPSRW